MTDKLREAAQQALEALEEFCETGTMLRPIERRDALRTALAEPQEDHSVKDSYELIMKWADIYAAETGNLYAEAARDPSKTARMPDERTMLGCVVAQCLSTPPPKAEPQEPDEVKQIAEALRQVGLTLIRTGAGFRVADLGRVEAQTAPQPRKRLTDEEIKACLLAVDPETKRLPPGMKAFTRAIEAAVWGETR